MRRYYKKNSYSPVTRTQHIGAQRAESQPSKKTAQRPPNPSPREQERRKCYGCGIVLRDPKQYIIDWINEDLHPVCIGCQVSER